MTDKQQALKAIERLPDDATLEEIKYELDVLAMLKQRMAEAREGNTIPHEEVVQKMKKWLE